MAPKIPALIESVDSLVIVRDQIAAILLTESANQQALALAAGKDPARWLLRVYTERANPWEEFITEPENGTADASPIVSVSWRETTFDRRHGNVVEQQRGDGIFWIDCYGYAVSEDIPGGGHVPGDELARREAQRTLGLVRQMLMSSPYTSLGLPASRVGTRWVDGEEALIVSNEERPAFFIAGTRLTLRVQYNEFAPQAESRPLDGVTVHIVRGETGQLLLSAQFPREGSP